ncbi:MAG: acyltransferase [Bdellovibrionota bacterium]|nr:MAG: acyltransferase [Bdellovibrionota bacterium]
MAAPEQVTPHSITDIPAMSPQQRKLAAGGSVWSAYKKLVVGEGSWPFFVWYELLMLGLSGIPGVAGLGARALFYPALFGRCQSRPAIGRGVSIRNPRRMRLGRKVMIDDYCAFDVRDGGVIELGSYVSIGRFSMIVSKNAPIKLGDAVNVSSYCRLGSQSGIEIGASTLIAAYAYIGAGNHQEGTEDMPIIERPMQARGGVRIGSNCWIGTHSTVLDGVTIGEGAIVGAHSFVRHDVEPYTAVAGTPAKVIRKLQ